tara:strand:- start:39 stop:725 length:687 start_codon:yes stop_codon:yes gene_type:complete
MGFHRGPNIVIDGLVGCLDAASKRSYPGIGNSFTNIINSATGTLSGFPTVSTNYFGTLGFNGTNQYMSLDTTVSVPAVGFTVLMCININNSQSASNWNYWFLQTANGGHKYEFGNYGTIGNRFHFKDNFNQSDSALTAYLDSSGFTVFHFGSTLDSKSFYSKNGASKTLSNGTSGWTGGDDIVFNNFFTNGSSSNFGATIGNMLIYNKELSADEITQNYNALKSRFGL